jgi:predicted regulator of amino acid metabolism with ACT domain
MVGTTLAKHNVNISNMALGKAPNGSAALMVLDTEGAVPTDCIEELRAAPGISGVNPIDEA